LRLCGFAGDIPIPLVAALPRWALRGEVKISVESAAQYVSKW
jgi:hypothetical protein